MRRTTLLLSEEHLSIVDRIARLKGVSKARVLREAIDVYAAQVLPAKLGLPSFAGCGDSGYEGSLGEDAEKLLESDTDRRGWK